MMEGIAARNTDNVDYTCSCAGCNGCYSQATQTYYQREYTDGLCASGSIGTGPECQAAATFLGATYIYAMKFAYLQSGCFMLRNDGVYYNSHPTGTLREDAAAICKTAEAEANGCMSTPVSGKSPGSNSGRWPSGVTTIEDCNDKCINTAACLAITYRQSETKCYTLDRTYDANFAAASDDVVVSNRVACPAVVLGPGQIVERSWTYYAVWPVFFSVVLFVCISCCLCFCGMVVHEGVVVAPDDDSSVPDPYAKESEPDSSIAYPKYWSNRTSNEFDEVLCISRDKHETFNQMLADSYIGKATQDRPCPKDVDPCDKTKGGCPCVQPDGDPGLPSGYIVRRVLRIEDSSMWKRYYDKRTSIGDARSSAAIKRFDPEPLTNKLASSSAEMFEPLSEELNEVYLWHGTSVRVALAIAQNDFRIDKAGSGAGTMYGRGAYLAESSTKADEYAASEKTGHYKNIHAMMLCRACMGKFYYTTQRDDKLGDRVASGEYDAVMGDRTKAVGTFREFVVYDADQVYPEYIMLYERIPPDGTRVVKPPFHMELPVYWSNFHRHPRDDPFNVVHAVSTTTFTLLQQLLSASYDRRKGITLVKARRVENSHIWNDYTDCRQDLFTRLKHELNLDEFVPVQDLDGRPDDGHVITHAHLSNNAELEGSVSIENLADSLNEHVLWHGTSYEASKKIIEDDFRVPKRGGREVTHGSRFGVGAYFAEKLEKSLQYAPACNGVQFILLCRVLCGDIYYTERMSEQDADETARQQYKDSILANPHEDGTGDREFIVLSERQVYPEFILEVREN